MTNDVRVARCRRRSIRLWEYDYRREGTYFVTICTHDRKPLFGSVVNSHVQLSDAGRHARECWLAIPQHFPKVSLDRFVIMPDHIHGIIAIRDGLDSNRDLMAAAPPDAVGARHGVLLQAPNAAPPHAFPRVFGKPVSGSLATIIGAFKSAVTRRLRNDGVMGPIWQRNYYEHIIRNDDDLWAIRRYIVTNPQRWHDQRIRKM